MRIPEQPTPLKTTKAAYLGKCNQRCICVDVVNEASKTRITKLHFGSEIRFVRHTLLLAS